jgi:V8-like Glu-specific endopeptidase
MQFAAVAGLAGCLGSTDVGDEREGSLEQPVVYGEDHRRDVYDYGDQVWAGRVAEFTAALMGDGVDMSNPNDVRFDNGTLEQGGVCSDERFAKQITAAFCSSTLIAPDLVITAGHCIDSGSCEGTHFVFDFYMTSATKLHTVTKDDVYDCAEVVAHELDNGLDYAIVRLDRVVAGRKPASVDDRAIAVAKGTPLVVHGYGSGLPLKIDDGGKVREPNAGEQKHFVANLDTFGGNSGSGVFRRDTGKLIGILVSGETDYVDDGDCRRVNVCPDGGCGGENSTYAYHAIAELCASRPDATLCAGGTCGDGVCSGDETAQTCPSDCAPGGTGVTFYQHINYGGAASGAKAKGSYASLPGDIPNDWMSSLKVPAGWTVQAFEHGNFGGAVCTFTASTSWVGPACNDKMSSFKIY